LQEDLLFGRHFDGDVQGEEIFGDRGPGVEKPQVMVVARPVSRSRRSWLSSGRHIRR
jgi:hypothetical protein